MPMQFCCQSGGNMLQWKQLHGIGDCMSKKRILPFPPMGWNSWDCYGAAVNEEQLLGNAAYMAKHLKKYGWEYIVCDIQWSEPNANGNDYTPFTELCMDEFSRLIPAENRFPSSSGGRGFRPIADKIHAMGLKFGIHIMRGIPRQAVHRNTKLWGTDKTAREIAQSYSVCPWNTDMYGVDSQKDGAQAYYDSLFSLYAEWGVDFVKVDDIANTEFLPDNPYSARAEIEMIRKALNNCGRDMVLSLSPGPAPISAAQHLSDHADMWRMTGDFWDRWDKLYAMFERCEAWYPYVGRGGYPDCDMLPLGRLCKNAPYCGEQNRYTNFTLDEQKTMLTLWSVFRSPLMLGGELRENDAQTNALLQNEEVIYVNQHGKNPHPVPIADVNFRLWTSQGENGETFFAVFNISDETHTVKLHTEVEGLADSTCIRDLWAQADIQKSAGAFGCTLPAHASGLYQLK